MNRSASALAVACLALLVRCAPPRDPRVDEREGGAPADASADLEGGAPAPASTRAAAPPRDAPDPVARSLAEARIVAIKMASLPAARRGDFEATLEGALALAPGATSRGSAALSLAWTSAPIAHRRPLAFSRLAAALDLHVVPAAVTRPISVGELGALLQDQPRALGLIRANARVQNDGTVDALLTAPAPKALGSAWTRPRAVSLSPSGSAEVRAWERWAGSPTPVPGERPTLLRDFVEMLVLDYLAAVVSRPTLLFLPEADALLLDDNRDAFPLHADPAAVEHLLRRLRDVARFPRGLRDALARFDRARAASVLAPGGFDAWLLSPRSLIELDERRAGLLSLIEAQIAERGAGAVLCL